jgi:transcriptional regulator with XRE-family HTH domain
MHYTQLFRSLREAKGLTIEELAKRARCHRNTVANVESGRPVKFKTLAELMARMGHGAGSPELKGIALLWFEAVSGLSLAKPETLAAARRVVGSHQSAILKAARLLEQSIAHSGLSADQIRLLSFAAGSREVLGILSQVRNLIAATAEVAETDSALKAAEGE